MCLAWAIPYALLRLTCFRSLDNYLFVGAIVLISASCYCSVELGWTPIPSEQGPDIPCVAALLVFDDCQWPATTIRWPAQQPSVSH